MQNYNSAYIHYTIMPILRESNVNCFLRKLHSNHDQIIQQSPALSPNISHAFKSIVQRMSWSVVESRRRWCLLVMFITLCVMTGAVKCPDRCHCRPDDRGRSLVECDAGSLGTAIPVFDMDRDTQVT